MTDPRDPAPNPAFAFDTMEENAGNLLGMMTVRPGGFAAQGRDQPPAHPAPGLGGGGPGDDTAAFRPRFRPPMALLCVVHDGLAGGEWMPLRGDRYVIARYEGDIRIPHDPQISKRQHAEVTRVKLDDDRFRWQLADLGSTNGTYVKATRIPLSPGTEILVGQTRYRFEAPAPAAPVVPLPTPPLTSDVTVRPGTGSAARPISVRPPDPTLVEITPEIDGPRVPLIRDEYWIGRDVDKCAIVPTADPFVSPRHARLFKEKNRWFVENKESRNGLWVRLTQPLVVPNACQFQLGEQRFILKVLV